MQAQATVLPEVGFGSGAWPRGMTPGARTQRAMRARDTQAPGLSASCGYRYTGARTQRTTLALIHLR